MTMPKTSQLQIRVSPSEKAVLKRLADDAGLSVSSYVLSKALPTHRADFEAAVSALRDAPDRGASLGVLAVFLGALSDSAFMEATAGGPSPALPPLLQNYAAAVVEREAARRGVEPPLWTLEVAPMPRPHFDWDLPSLRPHLMRVTPPSFKARRVFVATSGDPRR